MPRPTVPPARSVAALAGPAAATLRLGPVTLDLRRPHVVVRVAAADLSRTAGREAAAGAAAIELDLSGVEDPSAAAELVGALDAPVLVRGAATPAVLASALEAGAAGAVGHGDEVDRLVPPLASCDGAALLVLDRPGGGSPAERRERLGRAVAALAPAPVLREVDGPPTDPGLPLLVADPAAEAAGGSGDADLARARRVAALTVGVSRGGRLLLTGDASVARRAAEVFGALLDATTEANGEEGVR